MYTYLALAYWMVSFIYSKGSSSSSFSPNVVNSLSSAGSFSGVKALYSMRFMELFLISAISSGKSTDDVIICDWICEIHPKLCNN